MKRKISYHRRTGCPGRRRGRNSGSGWFNRGDDNRLLGLRQHGADAGGYLLQSARQADRAQCGRGIVREEGHGDRPHRPRPGGAAAHPGRSWRVQRGVPIPQSETSIQWQRQTLESDVASAQSGAASGAGAARSTAGRLAPARDPAGARGGGRRQGAARSGAGGLGSRPGAFQERRHLETAVRSIPHAVGQHRRRP